MVGDPKTLGKRISAPFTTLMMSWLSALRVVCFATLGLEKKGQNEKNSFGEIVNDVSLLAIASIPGLVGLVHIVGMLDLWQPKSNH